MKTVNKVYLFLATIFLFAFNAMAVPGLTTYQAKIIKPDGQPLESVSVNFRFTFLDPAASCILYIEDYSAISMANTSGLISFSLGTGAKTYPTSGTLTFKDMFSNSSPPMPCQSGGSSFTPTVNDTRKIVMQFNDTNGWQTLPAMSINAVPYSMYADKADNSILFNNKVDTAFVQYTSIPTCTGTQALQYTGSGFVCVAGAVSGSVTSGDITTALGYTPVNAASYSVVTSEVSNLGTSVTAITSTVSQLSASFAAIASNGGILSLDGSTSATQTFAMVHTGLTPGIATVNGLHSFTIPYAASASVTAGLLSNADYVSFSGKVDATSAAVIAALGYEPATATSFNSLTSTLSTNTASITANTVGIAANTAAISSLASSTATLSATVSGLTSSQWVTSGSTISYADNVGIGKVNPSAALDVSGTSRISGQVLFGRNPAANGFFNFGPSLGTNSAYKGPFFVQETMTDLTAANTVGNGTSLRLNSGVNSFGLVFSGVNVLQTVAAPVNYGSLYGQINVVENSATGSTGELLGMSSLVLQNSTGTVAAAKGVISRVFTYGGTVTDSHGGYFRSANIGGLIYNNYGIQIDSAAGLITNNYGLFISDQTAATASQTFNIYSVGPTARNIFMGRVGVGVDTPTAKLQISAGATSLAPLKLTSGSLLTSPQSGSIEYDGFNFYTTNGAGTRTAIGSGGGDSTWVASGTNAVFGSGRVGIGTSNPARRLDVYASAGTSSPMALRTSDYVAGSTGSALLFDFGATSGNTYSSISANSAGGSTAGYLVLNPEGGASGYVGIATSQPTQTLDVNGIARVRNWLNVGLAPSMQNAGDSLIINQSGATAKLRIHANSGGSQPTDGFHIFTDTASTTLMNNESGFLTLGTSGSAALYIASNRYIGIGTPSPGVLAASKTLTIMDPGGTSSLELRGFESAGRNLGTIDFMTAAGTPTFAGASIKATPGTYVGSANLLLFTSSGTANVERLRVTWDGKVGIGTSNPAVALDVIGDIQYTGTITDASDRRLKTNIEPLNSALSTVRKIKTYSYVMKDDPNARTEFGVMAQDILGIIPDLVKTIKGDYYGVNYVGLIPWSIRAIQEVDSETQNLRRENQEIKRELASIKEHNKVLEQKIEKIIQALEQQKQHGEQK